MPVATGIEASDEPRAPEDLAFGVNASLFQSPAPPAGGPWLVRAALIGAMMLLLIGTGTALWFGDDHLPALPAGPVTKPASPRKQQPAWELLTRPGTSPIRAVSAEPALSTGGLKVTPAIRRSASLPREGLAAAYPSQNSRTDQR